MDLFEMTKDITRAYCKQHGLPSPDGKEATADAHALLAEAKAALAEIASQQEQ